MLTPTKTVNKCSSNTLTPLVDHLFVSKLYSDGCHFMNLDNVTIQIPLQRQYRHNTNKVAVNAFVDFVLSNKDGIQSNMAN